MANGSAFKNRVFDRKGDSKVAKAEWGFKRVCPSCSARYYDMKKNPPICPSCGTAFDAETVTRSRRGKSAAEKRAAANALTPVIVIEDIPDAAAGEDDDAVIEDAEELGEEDLSEDVVVETEA
ncbi:MAG: TIGR02300 family protein [Alphaproteobacteria bacterium]